VKIDTGKAVLFLRSCIKLHLGLYHKSVWHFESKNRLGEVCVLAKYTILHAICNRVCCFSLLLPYTSNTPHTPFTLLFYTSRVTWTICKPYVYILLGRNTSTLPYHATDTANLTFLFYWAETRRLSPITRQTLQTLRSCSIGPKHVDSPLSRDRHCKPYVLVLLGRNTSTPPITRQTLKTLRSCSIGPKHVDSSYHETDTANLTFMFYWAETRRLLLSRDRHCKPYVHVLLGRNTLTIPYHATDTANLTFLFYWAENTSTPPITRQTLQTRCW
jgi:hypothetical protein